jgi:nitrite reductase (NADH) small subunit
LNLFEGTDMTASIVAANDTLKPICSLDDIWPDTGVCALVGRRQVAVFRLNDGRVFAIDNHDPNSGANVLSRGIVGDLSGEPVVASPIYKHHYQLRTGLCVENPDTPLRTYAVEVRDGVVWVGA